MSTSATPTIHPIPAFDDNYLWVMHDGTHAVAIDPGDERPVRDYLIEHSLSLSAVLVTHHHWDHVDGIAPLLDSLPAGNHIPVFGPARETIPRRTQAVREGDTIELLGMRFCVLDVPGHTPGHVAYHCAAQGILFCGDTLFGCGCGRLSGGTPAQMQASLASLARLAGDTRVYCTHEYTLANIRFALTVDPDNVALRARAERDAASRRQGLPTLPSTIALERATNPFLRWDKSAVIETAKHKAGSGDSAINASSAAPVLVFAAIRKLKDEFRS